MKYLGRKFRNKVNDDGFLVVVESDENVCLVGDVWIPKNKFLIYYEEIAEVEIETKADEIQRLEDKYDIRLSGFPKEMWVWGAGENEKDKIKRLVVCFHLGYFYACNQHYGIFPYSNAKEI